MTPHEKATELINVHENNAINVVNEILTVLKSLKSNVEILKKYRYFFEVKIIIENSKIN